QTVTVQVAAVNDTPVADSLVVQGNEDVALSRVVTGNDIENDTLSFAIVGWPAHGTVALSADGAFTYTPEANWSGSDQFIFMANDGQASSTPQTVTIQVAAVNDAPVAEGLVVESDEDEVLSDIVTADDIENDTLSFAIVSGPEHGTVSISADGAFTYTPSLNWHGVDGFTFRASDESAQSAPAAVTLKVKSVNDKPIARGKHAAASEDTLAIDSVSASDVDGDALTFLVADQPAYGAVVMQADGTFVYTPEEIWYGTDSFTFYADDGLDVSEACAVSIDVTAVNDAPAIDNLTVRTNKESPVSAIVAGNDIDDIDGNETLVFRVVDAPSFGQVAMGADGAFTYTPGDNWASIDTFTVAANDGQTDSNVATVTVLVGDRLLFDRQTRAQYHDADGNLVTLSLRGEGSGYILFSGIGDEDPNTVVLEGTTARSSLTISTSRGTQTDLSELVVNGSLRTLTAKTTNLTGTLTVSGAINKLSLGNTSGSIVIGQSDDPGDKVSLTLGEVADLSIQSDIPIRSLTAVQWLDLTPTADEIVAPYMGTLKVTGKRTMDLAGDFAAAITLTGYPDARYTLGRASIAGALTGVWDITGNTRSIKVGQSTSNWTLELDTADLKGIRLGEATNITIQAGNIGTVRADNWTGGAISGQTLYALRVAGNFGADVTVMNPAGDAWSVRNVRVGGDLAAGTWNILGAIRAISAGSFNDVDITATSIRSARVAGDMTGTRLTLNQEVDPAGRLSALGRLR
ncbi:MAG: tandem-95 repeat protein, partial [Planctomycetes bacterium]|nr:tandem-95 repeat protein [Planctomycetota bacterium]